MIKVVLLLACLVHTAYSCSCWNPDSPDIFCEEPRHNVVEVRMVSVLNEVDTKPPPRPFSLPPWHHEFPDMWGDVPDESGISVEDELARYGLSHYWSPISDYDFIGGIIEMEVEVVRAWGFGPVRVGQKFQIWSMGNGAMCGAKRYLQRGNSLLWVRGWNEGDLIEVSLCDFYWTGTAEDLDWKTTDCKFARLE